MRLPKNLTICAMDLYLYYYYLISCKHTFLLLAWENRVMYNTDRTARRKSNLRTARHRAGSTAVSERPHLPTLGGLGHTCSTFNFSPLPPRKTKASETPFFSLSFPKTSPPNFCWKNGRRAGKKSGIECGQTRTGSPGLCTSTYDVQMNVLSVGKWK